MPSRFVTFAAAYAEAVAAELDDLGARLVVYDSFAVIGRVAAALRGLPRVNVCAGHNVLPERFARELRADPRVRTSAACLAAVRTLKSRFGMADASPFSYLSPPSPQLNICCEPPEFFDAAERQAWHQQNETDAQGAPAPHGELAAVGPHSGGDGHQQQHAQRHRQPPRYATRVLSGHNPHGGDDAQHGQRRE